MRLTAELIGAVSVEESSISRNMYLIDVAYAGNAYFGETDTGILMRSEDLEHWDVVAKGSVPAFGNNLYAARTEKGIMQSEDGIHWEEYSVKDKDGNRSYITAAFFREGYFTNSWQEGLFSDDGINWIDLKDEMPEGYEEWDSEILYFNHQYVMLSKKGPDGTVSKDAYYVYTTTSQSLTFPEYASVPETIIASGSDLETTGTGSEINGWKVLPDLAPASSALDEDAVYYGYDMPYCYTEGKYFYYEDEDDYYITEDLIHWESKTREEMRELFPSIYRDYSFEDEDISDIMLTRFPEYTDDERYYVRSCVVNQNRIGLEQVTYQVGDREIIDSVLHVSEDDGTTWNSFVPTFRWDNAVVNYVVTETSTETPTVTEPPTVSQTPTVTDIPTVSQTPSVTETPTADTPANPTQSPTKAPTAAPKVPEKNKSYTVGNYSYKVTKSAAKNGTVTLQSPKVKTLTKVTIPATVKINNYTFTVTAIAAKAFQSNKKLKTVTVGSNIITIGDNAFAGCTALTKVTVGKNVTTLGKNVFSGDKKLKNIVIQSEKIKKVGTKTFSNIHAKATIKVPKKKLSAYQTLLKGKGQKKTVKINK